MPGLHSRTTCIIRDAGCGLGEVVALEPYYGREKDAGQLQPNGHSCMCKHTEDMRTRPLWYAQNYKRFMQLQTPSTYVTQSDLQHKTVAIRLRDWARLRTRRSGRVPTNLVYRRATLCSGAPLLAG